MKSRMTEMERLIIATRSYLEYVEEHYKNVQRAWDILSEKCKDMQFVYDDFCWHSIDAEIKEHDLSKLSSKEFTQYRDYVIGREDQYKHEFDIAVEQHYANNRHHWQNWTNRCYNGNPYKWMFDCVHMVADWMAMGMKFGDTAQQYYDENKHNIKLPAHANDFVYEIFKRIAD